VLFQYSIDVGCFILILKLRHGNVWAVICSVLALLDLRCRNGCR